MIQERDDLNPPASARAEIARQKMLSAALDVFGRYGFDGASTRQLTEAAGVNLQAIPYYFGSKEGLYIATAEYLMMRIDAHVSGMRARIGAHLMALDAAGEPLVEADARLFLTEVLQTMVTLFVAKESEPWARFLIREQMEPTEAFKRVYRGIMRPMIEMGRRLVGAILGEDPASEHVRLRTFNLVGSILIFRFAHASVLAQMEWDAFGPEQVEILRGLAAELVDVIGPPKGGAA
ncbi:AcrR family transcriptional regulator [Rhizobium aethiopicum]|uniref:AcrR family transcriptional regulator n=1 Tax=Rhizobium aethiopicum TaxID=1138170 RepID=A0A7W6MEY6_9HYPH|nr:MULTISPECIES: CerR family C-terminal domain-containing protein [Rhizobium]MBB4190677.1 AcrR family transcriptional regulator [Rhizobium aethiopicum]MBB4577866.1 AcrR family transcriptional regulator [Rhizobium aethiopicum]MDO3431305.1 CerR family C-terminal domain-containing protein [Rhizobium sp. CBN3]